MLSSVREHKVEGNALNELYKKRFNQVRKRSRELCSTLETEDFVIQPVIDVSPPKWHLGHTTWFFESFILKEFMEGYKEFHPSYNYLFNSYYESVGERWQRPNRGLLSRPTVKDVMDYREHVDHAMSDFFQSVEINQEIQKFFEIGLQHEQQHQELLVYDVKHILGINPMFPVFREREIDPEPYGELDSSFTEIGEGIYSIGYEGNDFCFDNEKGVHNVFLHPFRVQNRLITNGEYLEFIESGGYKDFRFWLSEAWTWVNEQEVKAPFHWHKIEGKWKYFTLSGLLDIQVDEPVTHINFFEADAYARWAGKRLLTEFEWEVACEKIEPEVSEKANFSDKNIFHPEASNRTQFLGDAWEWTNSAYLPYPYYKTDEGALGEYNGKFMINQMVLRGGSCATAKDHIRPTYRNFFHPHLKWHFTGIRIAESI
ncbi:MAG: ergothioneine biosynthesis protein EgtB [Bacteroidota bacterium]